MAATKEKVPSVRQKYLATLAVVQGIESEVERRAGGEGVHPDRRALVLRNAVDNSRSRLEQAVIADLSEPS